MWNVTNSFIVNLSVADLLNTVFNTIFSFITMKSRYGKNNKEPRHQSLSKAELHWGKMGDGAFYKASSSSFFSRFWHPHSSDESLSVNVIVDVAL